MGLFTPKCPRCGGVLQETGYSAPYPTHRCPSCIAAHERKSEVDTLRAALEQCQKALAMMIAPDAIRQSSVINAFEQCNAAELAARKALGKGVS